MGFFKSLAIKQMVKSQMKGVPEEQQEKIISAIEKNPKFFEDMAAKIQQKQKEGKDQMSAAMDVMRENQDELRKLMQ
ncbi:MAG: hypothetical protein WC884_03960 [Candidatus Paceibacterota bacterium]